MSGSAFKAATVFTTQGHPLDSWHSPLVENENHNIGLGDFMQFIHCVQTIRRRQPSLSPLSLSYWRSPRNKKLIYRCEKKLLRGDELPACQKLNRPTGSIYYEKLLVKFFGRVGKFLLKIVKYYFQTLVVLN